MKHVSRINEQNIITQCDYLRDYSAELAADKFESTADIRNFGTLSNEMKDHILSRYARCATLLVLAKQIPDFKDNEKQTAATSFLESGELIAGLFEAFPILLLLLIPLAIWMIRKSALQSDTLKSRLQLASEVYGKIRSALARRSQ